MTPRRLVACSPRITKFATLCIFLTTAVSAQIPRGQLHSDEIVEATINAKEIHTYEVSLEAGQFFHAVIEQSDADMTVVLFDPKGAKVRAVDTRWYGPEPVSLTAKTSGGYRMDVRLVNEPKDARKYIIRASAVRATVPADETQIRAEAVSTEIKSAIAAATPDSKRKALELCAEALQLWETAGDQTAQAQTLNSTGYLYNDLGDRAKAHEYYDRALALWKKLRNRSGEAEATHNIAAAYSAAGEKRKSLELYGQALAMRRDLNEPEAAAFTLTNMGAAWQSIGDAEKATEALEQSLPLWKQAGNMRGQVQTLINLGTSSAAVDESQKALEFYRLALPITRDLADLRGEAYINSNLGRIYDELGDPEKAASSLEAALSLLRRVEDRRGEAAALINAGAVYFAQRQFAKALAYYEEALAKANNDPFLETAAMLNLARLRDEMGDSQAALNMNEQALARARKNEDRRSEAVAQRNLAEIYWRKGDTDATLDHLNSAVDMFQAIGFKFGEANALLLMARAKAKEGRLTDALAASRRALEIVETMRTQVASPQLRSSYFASRHSFYQFHIDLLMRLHQTRPSSGYEKEALHTSERARGRGLLDLLHETRIEVRSGADAALLKEKKTVQQQLNLLASSLLRIPPGKQADPQRAAIQKQLEAAIERLDDVEAKLRLTSPRFAALTQPQPLSVADIQRLLAPGAVLVEYAFGGERTYAWVVTSDSVRAFELAPESEIAAASGRLRERLVRPATAWRTQASELRALLLGAFESELKGTKRIVIVPEAELEYVPFSALPLANGRLLGADHQIVYLPSASIIPALARNRQQHKPPRLLATVLADPVFHRDDPRLTNDGGSAPDEAHIEDLERSAKELLLTSGGMRLGRLWFTRQEANTISSLAPGRVQRFLDFKADREAATGPAIRDSRIVHFATHTLINNRHPELSGIVLSLIDSKGKSQDGFFRLHEIYNLELTAELVVMSSCESGLGKEVKGDGLIGFTRGFFHAGASQVLATLWKIDDRATAEFMRQFYARLIGSGLTAAEALRGAQTAMRNDPRGLWKSPYYWAGFVLQGQ